MECKLKSNVIEFVRFLTIVVFISSCGVRMKINSRFSAISFIKEESMAWKVDSIGKLGLRREIYYHINKTHNFTGVKWDLVKDYFGKPNIIATSFVKVKGSNYITEYVYFYKFNCSLNQPEDKLTIKVSPRNGRIIGLSTRYLDYWISPEP